MAKRKPPAPPTWDMLVAKEREQYRMMRRAEPSTPTWSFASGETVRFGNLVDCRIEAVEDGGKTYLLSFANVVAKDCQDNRSIKEDVMPRLPRLADWYDVLPVTEPRATSFGRESRIGTNYSQQMLESLVFMARRNGLNVTPDFQRDYVWTLDDKRRLVASIFDRADIGKFITMTHPWPENRITVIDGKQRLDAIMGFMEGRFDYEGVTWPQLSWNDRYIFQSLMVQVCELDAQRCKRSDVLGLFLRVNRGGVPQTDEHIARVRALYEQAVREESAYE